MKTMKILFLLIFILFISTGCTNSNPVKSANDTNSAQNIKIGKEITVIIAEDENVDYAYLQQIYDDTIIKDTPYFDLMNDDDFLNLIDYMKNNNYMIKSGTYTFNQAWGFDNGEFVVNNGERRKVLEFKEIE